MMNWFESHGLPPADLIDPSLLHFDLTKYPRPDGSAAAEKVLELFGNAPKFLEHINQLISDHVHRQVPLHCQGYDIIFDLLPKIFPDQAIITVIHTKSYQLAQILSPWELFLMNVFRKYFQILLSLPNAYRGNDRVLLMNMFYDGITQDQHIFKMTFAWTIKMRETKLSVIGKFHGALLHKPNDQSIFIKRDGKIVAQGEPNIKPDGEGFLKTNPKTEIYFKLKNDKDKRVEWTNLVRKSQTELLAEAGKINTTIKSDLISEVTGDMIFSADCSFLIWFLKECVSQKKRSNIHDYIIGAHFHDHIYLSFRVIFWMSDSMFKETDPEGIYLTEVISYALSNSCVCAEIVEFITSFAEKQNLGWNKVFIEFWPWFSTEMKRLPSTIFTLCEVIADSQKSDSESLYIFIVQLFLAGLRISIIQSKAESPKFQEFGEILELISADFGKSQAHSRKSEKYAAIIAGAKEPLITFAKSAANNRTATIDIAKPAIIEYISAVSSLSELIVKSHSKLNDFKAPEIRVKTKIVDEILNLLEI